MFSKFQEIVNYINIYIVPSKLDLCATLNRTKKEYFRYFWIFLYVLELNSFWPRRFSLNFKKLSIPSIFCLVNWTYVPRGNEHKVWFCPYFWSFSLYVLEHNSFLVSQIICKLQKIVNSISIYILPCKLDLCQIEQKVCFCRSFWLFLYVLELNSFSASQIFTKLQIFFYSINIYILSCKLDLCAT